MASSPSPKAVSWRLSDAMAHPPRERQELWEAEHQKSDYGNVFSVTEDAGLRKRLISTLDPLPESPRILIPGCGSRTLLERALLRAHPQAELWSCDFEGVVSLAASRFQHPQLRWRARDISRLGWRSVADAALLVNAAVSDSHAENQAILTSTAEALRPGGRLVGLFPSLFDIHEAGLIADDPRLMRRVDLNRCSVQTGDGHEQRYYGPLRLRHMLREAGLELERFEIVFLDTEHFRAEGGDPYRDDEPDLVAYEYLISARKPRGRARKINRAG